MKKRQSAFTLIELLVVITIIAILAIAITVGYRSVRDSARDAKRIEAARSISTALEIYDSQNGHYPNRIASGEPVVETLLEEGHLNSDPKELNISPSHFHASENEFWNNITYVDSRPDSYYVRVRNSDDIFCCTEDGCTDLNVEPTSANLSQCYF